MTEEGGSPAESPESTPAQEAGQVTETSGTESGSAKTDDGQGEKAPAQEAGQAKETPGGDKSGKAKAGGAEPPKFEGDTLKWLKSKGYEESDYDPANESHVKMINSARESEKLATKAAQEKKTQEAFEAARKKDTKPKVDTEGKEDLGPLKKYEKDYEDRVLQAMEDLGVKTAQDFYEKNPTLYNNLHNKYLVGRQNAWEKEQKWLRENQDEAMEQEKIDTQLRTDFEEARNESEKNLTALRVKHPDLDSNFAKYGVNDLTKALTDKFSVFPEMLFLDKAVAGWFAEAAEAIAYRHGESKRYDEWKEKYEKDRIEQQKANAPRPAGVGPGGVEKVASASGEPWDENLIKGAKKLVETR